MGGGGGRCVRCRLCRPGQRAAGTPAGGAAGGGAVLLRGGSLLCGRTSDCVLNVGR